MTLDDFVARIQAVASRPIVDRFPAFVAIEDAARGEDDVDFWAVRAAIRSAEQRVFELATTDVQARAALHEAVRATPWHSERIAALGMLAPDRETYRLVHGGCVQQLELQYGATKTAWFFALAAFARHPPFAQDARAFLLGAFDQFAARACKRGQVSCSDDHGVMRPPLLNHVAFAALAFVAAALPDSAAALHRALLIASGASDIESFYELNDACGPIAIALSAVNCRDAIADLCECVQASTVHDGELFLAQIRYALWILDSHGAGALASLRDPDNRNHLGIVAAALADLDFKPGRAVLAERATRLTNPIAREAFAEAISRLDAQTGAPSPANRMIWMFGRRSRYELSNAEQNDNVFVERAVERTGRSELYVTYGQEDGADEDQA